MGEGWGKLRMGLMGFFENSAMVRLRSLSPKAIMAKMMGKTLLFFFNG